MLEGSFSSEVLSIEGGRSEVCRCAGLGLGPGPGRVGGFDLTKGYQKIGQKRLEEETYPTFVNTFLIGMADAASTGLPYDSLMLSFAIAG